MVSWLIFNPGLGQLFKYNLHPLPHFTDWESHGASLCSGLTLHLSDHGQPLCPCPKTDPKSQNLELGTETPASFRWAFQKGHVTRWALPTSQDLSFLL